MPLFLRQLNESANHIVRADLRFWLHTQEPTDANPSLGRTTVGGGAFEAGVVLAASDISDAAGGDTESEVMIDFGTADEAAGTVNHLSCIRGASDEVSYWPIASTIIGSGDSFAINANSLDWMGSTT